MNMLIIIVKTVTKNDDNYNDADSSLQVQGVMKFTNGSVYRCDVIHCEFNCSSALAPAKLHKEYPLRNRKLIKWRNSGTVRRMKIRNPIVGAAVFVALSPFWRLVFVHNQLHDIGNSRTVPPCF